MRKILSMLVTFLPVVSYILFAQILFPNKYADFTEVYSAQLVRIKNYDEDSMEIVEQYEEDGLYYIEIVTTPEITIEMYSGATRLIYVNGTTFEATSLNVVTDSSNILIESNQDIEIYGNYEAEVINAVVTTNNVSISVGTILGILILLAIIKSKFTMNTKITITLTVLTIVFYMLTSIVTDIYWVLLLADAGWVAGLGVSMIPTRKSKKTKAREEKLDDFLGNV